MSSASPTISVITPNYNHGHFIAETVRSVAEQTAQPLEHVIVDDGSTDDSREIIGSLLPANPNLRLIVSDRNRGAAAAMYRGTLEAKGDFLMYLGADDALPSWSLARFSEIIKASPDAALVCGDIEYINQATSRRWRRRYLNVPAPVYLSPEELVALQRRMIYVINGGAAIIKRGVALEVGMNDAALRWHLDFMCYNATAYRYGVHYIPETLHRFTVTGKNYSGGANIWSQQQLVLDHMFGLLSSPSYSDVADKFRESAVLATASHIVRYLMRHPEARGYLTVPLVMNAWMIAGYRTFRSLVPQWALDLFVGLRGRR
jgi:glycosyltransferase involved in cell wall biosynthesis